LAAARNGHYKNVLSSSNCAQVHRLYLGHKAASHGEVLT